MRGYWKYVWIFIGVLLISILIYLSLKKERKTTFFKKIEFNQKNSIFNRTPKNYLDTIIFVGLEELCIENSTVIIYPLTNDMKEIFPEEYTLKAFIKGIESTYFIWIDDMGRAESIQVLSHELIHLQQYYHKRLTYSDNPYVVIWENSEIDIRDLNYEQRPWECEAFEKEVGLEKKILTKLF